MITLKVKGRARSIDLSFPISERELETKLSIIDADTFIQPILEVEKVIEPKCMHRLEGQRINLDEINYLAKRIDSFTFREENKYYAIVEQEMMSNPKDMINLTFDTDYKYTLIQDISNMTAVGKAHVLSQQGGIVVENQMSDEEYAEIGRKLMSSGTGVLSEYGLLFKNTDAQLAEVYNGEVFPMYSYDGSEIATVEIACGDRKEYLYLPCEPQAISKAFFRLGCNDDFYSAKLIDFSIDSPEWKKKFELYLDQEEIYEMNRFAESIGSANVDLDKLSTIVEYAEVDTAREISRLADYLDYFEIIPDADDYEAVGNHLVDYDDDYSASDSLRQYIDHDELGQDFANEHDGEFTSGGFVYIDSELTLSQILDEDVSMGHHQI